MTQDDKELAYLCEAAIRDYKSGIISESEYRIATELKHRIEQPSEREKALADALKHYAEVCGEGEGRIAREALAAYEEKEEVK